MKELVVNADDFGYTPGVNEGIIDAYRNGIVRSTTLMAPVPAFADAVARWRVDRGLDVGVHIVLAGPYEPLTGAAALPALTVDGRFHRSPYAALWGCWRSDPRALRNELRAQVEKVLTAGITPSHIDCHKHLHVVPFLWRVFASVAREYSIPFMRRPGDTVTVPLEYPMGMAGNDLLMRFLAERSAACCPHRTLPHFFGQGLVGNLEKAALLLLAARLPDGATELMVHPGRVDEVLRSQSRLTASREIELHALCDPEVKETLARHGVALTNFAKLARSGTPEQ